VKILVIVHGFPPAAEGGSEIYAQAHALALRRQCGDEVVVFTREHDPNRAEYDVRTEQRDGLRIIRVNNNFRNTRTFEETYRNEQIGAIASRVIDDVRPDVAHIHHLTCLSTTIVRSLVERRIPSFITLHDYWLICHRGQLLDVDYRVCEGPAGSDGKDPRGCRGCLGPAGGAGKIGFLGAGTMRALERRLPATPGRHLRRLTSRLATVASSAMEAEHQMQRRLEHMRDVCADVTHFLAPSGHMRDRFVQFGVAPGRITVSGYGVDHAPFARIERTPSPRLRLGFLGSLMMSKAPHVLLEAIGRLPRGAVSVDLFGPYSAYHGDDRYRHQLEPLLKQDGVTVHSAIPHDRVAQALSSIDVLVVPSIWPENSPLVIQEAFLAGVPVVASRIGGIPEAVDDGRNGLLFRAGDSGDLARTLTRLLRDPGLLNTLRSGIPPVRTIEEDVQFARSVYQAHLGKRLNGRPGDQEAYRLKNSETPELLISCEVDRAGPARLAAVVLNYRTPDDTLLAVKSLLASRRPIQDIIVVDNDDNDGANRTHSAGLDREALKDVWSRVSCVPTGRNLGFSGGMNVGIREALARGADRVLLANSDVIVPPDCVAHLEQSLDRIPHAGIAGPVVLARSDPGRVTSLGMSYAPSSGRMRDRAVGTRFADLNLPVGRVVDGVSGCLMLVEREVFEAVGLLVEDYFFGFEDLDFCLKARRAGFATVLAGSATVYHEGSRSIGAETPRRLYFAARNHLLLAQRLEPPAGRLAFLGRASWIVLLNLAHAARSKGGSLPARLSAVAQGVRDYAAGRFGID
jgi:GT2 family glycosyltransferase/glycosyltransferase involved in cell wall biosynthesis